MEMIIVDKELIENALVSLDSMIGYADDGMLSRNDPTYADFFKDIDEAKEAWRKLDKAIENAQHYYDEDDIEMTKADMEFHRRRDEEI